MVAKLRRAVSAASSLLAVAAASLRSQCSKRLLRRPSGLWTVVVSTSNLSEAVVNKQHVNKQEDMCAEGLRVGAQGGHGFLLDDMLVQSLLLQACRCACANLCNLVVLCSDAVMLRAAAAAAACESHADSGDGDNRGAGAGHGW